MSFLTENTAIPSYSILVLEPYDITWLGIQQLLQATMGDSVSLIRIKDIDCLADAIQHCGGKSILLSVVGQHTEVLPLLKQFALIMQNNKKVHIAAYLRKELPHLVDLLLAFGVDTVFRGSLDMAELANFLVSTVPPQQSRPPSRLTRQECKVAQALLAGKSVTRVAQLMCKDIRTISSHKQALLGKLNMNNGGELQVLGGQLMACEEAH